MGLHAKDFDKMHYDNKALIVNSIGIKVVEKNLFHEQSIVLFSVYNFFVETIVNKMDGRILSMDRLTLDQVTEDYCKDLSCF